MRVFKRKTDADQDKYHALANLASKVFTQTREEHQAKHAHYRDLARTFIAKADAHKHTNPAKHALYMQLAERAWNKAKPHDKIVQSLYKTSEIANTKYDKEEKEFLSTLRHLMHSDTRVDVESIGNDGKRIMKLSGVIVRMHVPEFPHDDYKVVEFVGPRKRMTWLTIDGAQMIIGKSFEQWKALDEDDDARSKAVRNGTIRFVPHPYGRTNVYVHGKLMASLRPFQN